MLVTGGFDGDDVLSSVELLNLQPKQSPQWITVAPMLQPRLWHGMCLFRKKVIVAGGWRGNAEMFSPPRYLGDLGQWTDLQPLSQLRGQVTLTVWRRRLLAFGKFII